MKVAQIYMRNPLRNFNYIVYSEANNNAIFIDPLDIDKTLPVAEKLGLRPRWLLNTHGHPDHVKDNQRFISDCGAELLTMQDGEVFELSPTESIKAIHTPGHTQDHFCFLLLEGGEAVSLISGDTLFNAGVGHCKLGGDPEALYHTVSTKIAELPGQLLVYPGHDYLLNNLGFALSVEPDNAKAKEMLAQRERQDLDNEFMVTTLELERQINPFLRLERLQELLGESGPKETFLRLRALRDKW